MIFGVIEVISGLQLQMWYKCVLTTLCRYGIEIKSVTGGLNHSKESTMIKCHEMFLNLFVWDDSTQCCDFTSWTVLIDLITNHNNEKS